MVLVGGSEVLRDEQIYFAHKAANPRKYPPPSHESDAQQIAALNRWKRGTDVVLQVFDDCCHVTPTLSFTKPAKYMYRSIARFGDWLFAREALGLANPTAGIPDTVSAGPTDTVDVEEAAGERLFSPEGTQIVKADTISIISDSSTSSDSETEGDSPDSSISNSRITRKITNVTPVYDIPNFLNHMVRQRVDRKGNIYPLPSASELPCMQVAMEDIGCIKPEPVRRWMEGKQQWDSKYAKAKKRVQLQRAKEIAEGGYLQFEDDGSGVVEKPPPSALAGRRRKEGEALPDRSFKPSYGLKLWSFIGSKQDTKTIKAEDRKEGKVEKPTGGELAAIKEVNEEPLSSSSSEGGSERLPEKTQSQIDRDESIGRVPDAVSADAPIVAGDAAEQVERLGQEDSLEVTRGEDVEAKS
ncbi:hypothetical protein ABW19_dt0205764 [Dactylella cylindrospora]|nr:hypothetical protein ABW19_dt0205764 [Dactylella cylindrospora]